MDIKQFQLGCLGSPVDERDVLYNDIACASSDSDIPNEFELKYQFNAKNQGQVGSCVAHSISECEEIIKAVAKQFSVGFVYGYRRDSDFQGAGMIIREALVNLTKFGNVYNEDFPVNAEYPSIKKNLEDYGLGALLGKASKNISKGFVRLWQEDLKKYLVTEKKPVIMSVKVYKNFYELQSNKGIVPKVPVGDLLGGHAVLVVGYKGDMLKVLNSWGTVGDNGYIYVDINSVIIKELWGLTDEKVYNPTPTPTPTPSPSPTPTSDTIYRVQVEADSIRANADARATELRSKGIDCIVKTYTTPKGTLYKVQVGAYKIKANAVAKREELVALGYKDAYITEY